MAWSAEIGVFRLRWATAVGWVAQVVQLVVDFRA